MPPSEYPTDVCDDKEGWRGKITKYSAGKGKGRKWDITIADFEPVEYDFKTIKAWLILSPGETRDDIVSDRRKRGAPKVGNVQGPM